MMISHYEVEAEEAEEKVLKEGRNLDRMHRQVQNLFKFENFYAHMDFNPDHLLAITKGSTEH